MGTSGSYGGSGGRDWNKLRDGVADWLDQLPGTGNETPGNNDAEDNGGGQGDEAQPGRPDQPTVSDLIGALGIAIKSSGGASDGPSAGGGIGLRGTARSGGSRSPSGAGRSTTRAGRVGGRLTAGILGFQTDDRAALEAIGIDFAEMQNLDTYGQAKMLVRAATENSVATNKEEVATNMEDEEIRTASYKTAIWALESSQAPEAIEIVQRFILEYVYRLMLTESGAILRSGNRDGIAAVTAENELWNTISALVRGFPIRPTGMDPAELGTAAKKVLEQVLQIHGKRTVRDIYPPTSELAKTGPSAASAD